MPYRVKTVLTTSAEINVYSVVTVESNDAGWCKNNGLRARSAMVTKLNP